MGSVGGYGIYTASHYANGAGSNIRQVQDFVGPAAENQRQSAVIDSEKVFHRWNAKNKCIGLG